MTYIIEWTEQIWTSFNNLHHHKLNRYGNKRFKWGGHSNYLITFFTGMVIEVQLKLLNLLLVPISVLRVENACVVFALIPAFLEILR